MYLLLLLGCNLSVPPHHDSICIRPRGWSWVEFSLLVTLLLVPSLSFCLLSFHPYVRCCIALLINVALGWLLPPSHGICVGIAVSDLLELLSFVDPPVTTSHASSTCQLTALYPPRLFPYPRSVSSILGRLMPACHDALSAPAASIWLSPLLLPVSCS